MHGFSPSVKTSWFKCLDVKVIRGTVDRRTVGYYGLTPHWSTTVPTPRMLYLMRQKPSSDREMSTIAPRMVIHKQ